MKNNYKSELEELKQSYELAFERGNDEFDQMIHHMILAMEAFCQHFRHVQRTEKKLQVLTAKLETENHLTDKCCD